MEFFFTRTIKPLRNLTIGIKSLKIMNYRIMRISKFQTQNLTFSNFST